MPHTNHDAGHRTPLYNPLKAAAKMNVPGTKALAAELAERFAQSPETPDTAA